MACHLKILLYFLLLFASFKCYTQNIGESNLKKIDEAIKELERYPKPDTARLSRLIKVIDMPMFKAGKEKVMSYYFEAKELSKKVDSKKGIAYCYYFIGSYEKSKMNYTIALQHLDSMTTITQNSSDSTLNLLNAASYNQKGLIYNTQQNYYAALSNFFESLKFYRFKNSTKTKAAYKMIGNIYYNLFNYKKSIEYNKYFLAQSIKTNDIANAIDASILLSQVYIDVNKIDSAKYFLNMFKADINDSLDNTLIFAYYQKVGLLNYLENDFVAAETNFKKALTFTTDPMHSSTKAYIISFYAKNELKRGHISKAKSLANEYLQIAKKNNDSNHLLDAYRILADCFAKSGNSGIALSYLQKSVAIKDSVLSETNLRQANMLAAVYESEKKEKDILNLEAKAKIQENILQRKSLLNYLLILGAVALLIIGFFGYRNFKNRQKIQHLKIVELEKDKQLLSVNAMLKGQEEERNRIAKDLHDGLGGMLSGVKMSFTNMKENMIMSSENVGVFEQSISQLDSTISELRKIAHNLMPEALVKFGLNDAIKDFCMSIMSATHINIIYESMGEVRTLDNTANTYIYRIIQELINNAVKHAKPTQILVQLTTSSNKVLLTVEDNGQGLDSNKLAASKGIGITNIKHRINYFKGTIHFDNNTPHGTVVNIELNL